MRLTPLQMKELLSKIAFLRQELDLIESKILASFSPEDSLFNYKYANKIVNKLGL